MSSFAQGVRFHLDGEACEFITEDTIDGTACWFVRKRASGKVETRSLERLRADYDRGRLRFDDRTEPGSPEEAKRRERRRSVPVGDLPKGQCKQILFASAVLEAVEQRTVRGMKTARVVVDGRSTGPTVLASMLDELGANLGREHFGEPRKISVATYYRWVKKLNKNGDRRDLGGEREYSGNRMQMQPEVKRLLTETVASIAQGARFNNKQPNGLPIDRRYIFAQFRKAFDLLKTVHPGKDLKMPSDKTIYNCINEQDRFLLDCMQGSSETARKSYRRPLVDKKGPEAVLDVVQYDESLLPFFCVDDTHLVPLGRPTVSFLVDVHSTCLVGFHMGFDPSSDLVTLSALRHACSMKSYMSEIFPNLPAWRYSGMPRSLVYDNSLTGRGKSLADAGALLDFPRSRTATYTPWAKNEVENTFNVANRTMLSMAPGYVLPKTLGLDTTAYDPAANAVIGFSTLWYLLHAWALQVHAMSTLPGSQMTRDQLWTAGTQDRQPDFPNHGEDLDLLFGVVREARLDERGIVFEHLRYYGDHAHRLRMRHGAVTKVRVKLNPMNMQKVYVWDDRERMWFPCYAVDRTYTAGLDLHRHKLYRAHAARMFGEADTVARFRSAEAHMQALIEQALPDGIGTKLGSMLARTMGVNTPSILAGLEQRHATSRSVPIDGRLVPVARPGGLLQPLAGAPDEAAPGGRATVHDADPRSTKGAPPVRRRVLPEFHTVSNDRS